MVLTHSNVNIMEFVDFDMVHIQFYLSNENFTIGADWV